jgi:hypothetical protein
MESTFRQSPNPFDITTQIPNLPQATSKYPQSSNQFDSAASLPDHGKNFAPTTQVYNHDSKLNTNQHVQMSVNVHLPHKPEIPTLNHDQAIKRAKIQFTGLGDIFVFYNQLMNGMEQFGIFLIPLNNVSYQIDFCPPHYHNIPITPYQRTQMASTLYQKLQDTDVIPMECTAI